MTLLVVDATSTGLGFIAEETEATLRRLLSADSVDRLIVRTAAGSAKVNALRVAFKCLRPALIRWACGIGAGTWFGTGDPCIVQDVEDVRRAPTIRFLASKVIAFVVHPPFIIEDWECIYPVDVEGKWSRGGAEKTERIPALPRASA
jgi:hypothetical protein